MSGGPGGAGTAGVPGRVEITAKALATLARAVAAERLGAPAKRLRVGLDDHDGALALEVTGPIAADGDVVSAASSAADTIRSRVGELSGRRVGRTHIELTGLVREHEGRVR